MDVTYFNDEKTSVNSFNAIDNPEEVKELYCNDNQLTSFKRNRKLI